MFVPLYNTVPYGSSPCTAVQYYFISYCTGITIIPYSFAHHVSETVRYEQQLSNGWMDGWMDYTSLCIDHGSLNWQVGSQRLEGGTTRIYL